jgi:dUTP pyrophosphatase
VNTIQLSIAREPGTDDLPLPEYKSELASGMDLVSAVTDPVTIEPGQVALVPTGIRIALPAGYEAQVRPRSGLAAKHGVTVVNAPGTVDADYRGEIKVILGNVSNAHFTVTRGMRIAQMVIAPVVQARLEEVASLEETARGDGGFGHTGTH